MQSNGQLFKGKKGLELMSLSTYRHNGDTPSHPRLLSADPPDGLDKIQRQHAEEESGVRLKGKNYCNEVSDSCSESSLKF